jgi:DNA-binding protein H-NS
MRLVRIHVEIEVASRDTRMDERKRDSIVAYLQRRMAEFDITPEVLAASIADDQRRLSTVRYRDASGNGWDGEGTAPQWVINVTSAGQSLDHFAVRTTASVQVGKRAGIDWRDDPFAGSRLASPNSR